MGFGMYGVVLWSDKEDSKAVIWCEDHGDLAFYSCIGASALEGQSLDAGDLVHFSIAEGEAIRVATNPTLVAEQQYPGLAERLRAQGMVGGAESRTANTDRPEPADTSNVIAFAPRNRAARLAS